MTARWSIATWIVISLLIGGAVGTYLGTLLLQPMTAEVIQSSVGSFLTSPGAGGIGAVVAACIAYIAATRTLAATRRELTADRKQKDVAQWWESARWATDMLLSVRRPGVHTADRPPGWELFTDPDAMAAITARRHLPRTAPSTDLTQFVTDVMAAALDVTDTEKGSASTAPATSPGRRFPVFRTRSRPHRQKRRTAGSTARP